MMLAKASVCIMISIIIPQKLLHFTIIMLTFRHLDNSSMYSMSDRFVCIVFISSSGGGLGGGGREILWYFILIFSCFSSFTHYLEIVWVSGEVSEWYRIFLYLG